MFFRTFKVSFFVTACITIIIIIINHFLDGSFWQGWKIEPSIYQGCFCEHNYMERFIRQPFNTWSNVAFLFFGVAILGQSINNNRGKSQSNKKPRNNYLVRNPIIGIGFGILLCILFAGSFLFHASLTVFFGITDMIGTYGIPLYLGMIALTRILVYKNILKEKAAAVLCVAVSFVLGFALADHWLIFINMIITFSGLLMLAALGGMYLFSRKELLFNKRLFIKIFFVVSTACILWIIDHNNIICDPYSNIQGHSFWHVLNALAAYLMYEFFYSEEEFTRKSF